ncbi:hypothetical protein ABZP12_01632 [Xanthomonas euvesicatoria]
MLRIRRPHHAVECVVVIRAAVVAEHAALVTANRRDDQIALLHPGTPAAIRRCPGLAFALLERQAHVHRFGRQVAFGQVRAAIAQQIALPAQFRQLEAQALLFQDGLVKLQSRCVDRLGTGLRQCCGQPRVIEGQCVAATGRLHQAVFDRRQLRAARHSTPIEKMPGIHPHRRRRLPVHQRGVVIGQAHCLRVLRRRGSEEWRRSHRHDVRQCERHAPDCDVA